MKRLLTFFCMVCSLVIGSFVVTATAALSSETVLTLRAGESVREYSMADLEALGATEIETKTIWTEGPQVFVGVSIPALMKDAEIDDGVLIASAVNDYSIEIPLADETTASAIIAYSRNGETMSLRDKGPLWVIYPYSRSTDYQSEAVYSRSIWQLNRIALK